MMSVIHILLKKKAIYEGLVFLSAFMMIFCLQLRVVAFDPAYPDKKASTDVIITVLRNVNGPIFVPSATYDELVFDTTDIGASIVHVSATDQDQEVCT